VRCPGHGEPALKISLMAQAQSAVAQKGRDGASFTRRGEGYFGHAVDGAPFLRP